jgi:glyoxylase-like metal-dependent hydrolase (beta-lactamase superfamily II)
MKITTISVGMNSTNCYIISNGDDKSEVLKYAVIIDPGDEASVILGEVKKRGLNVKAILLTHGHFDHIGVADALAHALKVPVYGSKEEAILAADTSLNCYDRLNIRQKGHKSEKITCRINNFFKDGEVFDLRWIQIHALLTPGHTSGHMCYYIPKEGVLFSGDTLFKGAYGRHDLPTSDFEQLKQSLNRLFELPPQTTVFPGHGEPTTIKEAKECIKFW